MVTEEVDEEQRARRDQGMRARLGLGREQEPDEGWWWLGAKEWGDDLEGISVF